MTRDNGTEPSNDRRIERRTDASVPTTRRRALQATAVGLGAIAGLGGGASAGSRDGGGGGGGEECRVPREEMEAVRDEWADPAMVQEAVAAQDEMLATLGEAGYAESTADSVAVTARRLECEAVPEILVFRRPGDRFLTASVRPESGSAYAIVTPPGGGDGGGGGGDDWFYYTMGEKGCHPSCSMMGLCCECQRRPADPYESWDWAECTDYRCWYYVFECDCDCPDDRCWPFCVHRLDPVVVDMPTDWWEPLP